MRMTNASQLTIQPKKYCQLKIALERETLTYLEELKLAGFCVNLHGKILDVINFEICEICLYLIRLKKTKFESVDLQEH